MSNGHAPQLADLTPPEKDVRNSPRKTQKKRKTNAHEMEMKKKCEATKKRPNEFGFENKRRY